MRNTRQGFGDETEYVQSEYVQINLYTRDPFGSLTERRLLISPVRKSAPPVITSSNIVLPTCPFCKGQAGSLNDDLLGATPHVGRRQVGCFGFHGECAVQPKAQGSSDEAAIAGWKRLCAAIEDPRPVPAGTVQIFWFEYLADAERLLCRSPSAVEISALQRRFTEGFSVYFAVDEILGYART